MPLSYQEVKNRIESVAGYKLISTSYTNRLEKLRIECDKGHRYLATLHHFDYLGSRCPECNKRKKLTYSEVKDRIESEEGYQLLSTEYKNIRTKLVIKCSRGHIYEATISTFGMGRRCPQCFNENQQGCKNSNYNPQLTDEDRLRKRQSSVMYAWRIAIYEKFDYTCQICGSKDNLIAHHINSFQKFPELRADLNNGACLCDFCHKQIHQKYGRYTTIEHWLKFMNEVKKLG